jgi:hypothetical protein
MQRRRLTDLRGVLHTAHAASGQVGIAYQIRMPRYWPGTDFGPS